MNRAKEIKRSEGNERHKGNGDKDKSKR